MESEPSPVEPTLEQAETELAQEETELAQEEERRIGAYFDRLRDEESFAGGLLAGLVAAALSAAAWAAIAVGTQRTFGLFAIVVGLFVAFAVRRFGRGMTVRFAVLGAALAILGCVVGNVAGTLVMAGQRFGMNAADILQLVRPAIVWDILTTTTGGFELLFYGIAAYEGWRFSRRRVSADEVAAVVGAPQA